MSDNASIARPYAKAVFELAKENSAFDAWASALNQVNLVTEDESFNTLCNDPRVEDGRLAELVIDICKDNLPHGGTNFINLLVQNSRLDIVADIEQQYAGLVAQAQKSITAEVITAIALTDSQKSALSDALEARLGLKVNLDEVVDSSLIGGAIVRAGDLVIDGSAKGRIEKLATVLAR